MDYFEVYCLVFKYLEIFFMLHLLLIFEFVSIVFGEYTLYGFNYFKLIKVFCFICLFVCHDLGCGLSWYILHRHLKGMYIMLLLGEVLYKCWLYSVSWWRCWVFTYSCWFGLVFLSNVGRRVMKSLIIIVSLSIFFSQFYQVLLLLFFSSVIWCIYFRTATSWTSSSIS